MPDEFLNTHRSLTAATHEFTRLGDCLADGASVWSEEMDGREIRVRRSPDRCIIQVERAAVTVAWLPDSRDAGAGELLVIHWNGIVAPAIHQQFERARELTSSATPVYESVFLAEATCEADWMWRTREDPVRRYTSPFLASLVVERLRAVHEATARQASA